jgi:hypothetical protein
MKKLNLINLLSIFLISGTLLAQSADTVSAKMIGEKGTKGDIILGNEYKQKQLSANPQVLQTAYSIQKKETAVQSKKKKNRH